eukprot:Rmarinus@m.21249
MGSRQLSDKLQSMKFMQRSAEAKLRSELEEERKRTKAESEWVAVQDSDHFIIETDTGHSMSLKTGRRSFGRFNPAVEELRNQKDQKRSSPATKQSTTVTDEQMAQQFVENQGQKRGGVEDIPKTMRSKKRKGPLHSADQRKKKRS